MQTGEPANFSLMQYITGFCAFTHKAGIHAKAILANPSTYEAIKPEDFGMSRYIHIGSRITGWHAVKSRVEQLQLDMTEAQIKDVTAKIKELADVKTQSMEDVDAVLRIYHRGVSTGEFNVGQKHELDHFLTRQADSPDAAPVLKKAKIAGALNGNGVTNGVNGH